MEGQGGLPVDDEGGGGGGGTGCPLPLVKVNAGGERLVVVG